MHIPFYISYLITDIQNHKISTNKFVPKKANKVE